MEKVIIDREKKEVRNYERIRLKESILKLIEDFT